MRRKGERPVVKTLQRWSPDHPVARAIATGDYWFGAWQRQSSTPIGKLSRETGIPIGRLMAIDQRDRVTRAEIDALARAFCVSADDLILSTGCPEIVVE